MSYRQVWREGERIRDKSGTGYSDHAGDEVIHGHIERSLDVLRCGPVADAQQAFDHIVFARAVLALRVAERAGGEK